ncbi:hypothetical protein HDIA_0737 [Hartmannibacter diazotrophicus]|uniref:HTH luxR-type domain-containing protein n=2 Tax=Hartmannibacter diazotrophicus TaxID=1482074 RepID=A0A2C9D2A3_9HYPH|nr:hypothetical protein HDIA_0737 [Hartmannibacter diazotrophicus]
MPWVILVSASEMVRQAFRAAAAALFQGSRFLAISFTRCLMAMVALLQPKEVILHDPDESDMEFWERARDSGLVGKLVVLEKEQSDDVSALYRDTTLTPRENDIAELAARRRRNKQIAADLGINPDTAKKMRSRPQVQAAIHKVRPIFDQLDKQ